MTALEDLVAAVERNPTNPIVAAMLTDELMDARDMLRSEADAHVRNVQSAGGTAAQIRVGCELLANDTECRRYLLAQVFRTCGVPRGRRPTVIVTEGDKLRVTEARLLVDDPRYWGRVVILVGAAWLLYTWDARLTALAARRRLRRSVQKSD